MLQIDQAPWPSFTQEEADAVANVILSNKVNYWTGQEGRLFEAEFAKWCTTDHAIAVANGTVALDLALVGLNVGLHNGGNAQDEVIVTPRTFLASASCVVTAGAVPMFADVDPNSGNITAETISKVITPNTKAIIVVHLAGWPCDMDSIMELANLLGIKVVEDCAQAHGARYKGHPVGSIGHIGAWSFCQDKIMTTGGEGGMVTTNDRDLWLKMWAYKDHGKSWSAVYERKHPLGFRWLHESFGTNWRMLEVQAAIGRIQLKRMADWTNARASNAFEISGTLAPFCHETGPIRLPNFQCKECTGCPPKTGCLHAQYKFYVYVRPENLANGWTRDRIANEISSRGVACFQGSCSEVYLEKAFDGTEFRPTLSLPKAKALGETSLMFLVHPTLTKEDLARTIEVISEVLRKACSAP